jgi:hypothetical protein
LTSIFLPDAKGNRPAYGDTGRGHGASHRTGWTGLVAKLLQQSGAIDRDTVDLAVKVS